MSGNTDTLVLASWTALIEVILDAVWLVNAADLKVVAANSAAGTLFGVEASSLSGRLASELGATPEDQVFWCEAGAGLTETIVSDTFARRADGTVVPITRRVSRLSDWSPEGLHSKQAFYVVSAHDRSNQSAAEEELERRMAELRATLESTADGILVVDLRGGIRGFNRRFSALWSVPAELLTARNDAAIVRFMGSIVKEEDDYSRRLAAIQEAPLLQATDVFVLKDGTVVERVTVPQCCRGQPIGRVFSFRDITEKLAATQRIEELSYTDVLTGLPNRLMLADRVEYALAAAQYRGQPFALMVLNLDRFKHINDSMGIEFGDRVLLEATKRIKACLRGIDTVARLGSDEFVLLVHQADVAGAEATARRVLEIMSRPFSLDDVNFTVTCSIGIARCPADGDNFDELLRRADAAMHRVKEAGRASFRFYEAHRDVVQRSHIQLDHSMRQALTNGQFRLHYQPQVDLKTGRVIGAEALIRWRDPMRGDVAPAEFIPIAEESGFIIAIGDWVLSHAVRQAAMWKAKGMEMRVAVNVSALQFQQPDFTDRVAATLKAAQLPPGMLELELTESILIQDAQDALQRLRVLEHLGVTMSIDDFGTGYSSLAYLKRFPIGRLKIDRSFIKNLPGDGGDSAIVNAIIQLGKAMQLKVIAEGVETEAQRKFLFDSGCDEYQGFLFAPALEPGGFEARLASEAALFASAVLV